MGRFSRLSRALAFAAGLTAAAGSAARASENGASFYLLGSGGPEVAIMPPLEGVFLSNTYYYYDGASGGGRQFVIGGAVVAGVRASVAADFPTVLWVPSTNFLGGTLALGATAPFGQPWADVSVVLTGPRGGSIGISRSSTVFVLGDPVLTGMLGWTQGKTHFQLSDMLNVPVGDYRKNQLANLAFHRWANDMAAAVSWHDDKSGWDISAKSGFTVNGTNNVTDYRTGTEWHVEGAIDKAVSPAFSIGVQAYHFDQLTGDSGAGAVLGPFKGRVTGVGGSAAYNFTIMGKIPATLRFHGAQEFSAQNRLQGKAFWLDFSMPLHVKTPPDSPAA